MSEIKKNSIYDFYFNSPIVCDFIALCILWGISYRASWILIKVGLHQINILHRAEALTYLAYIASANVTLAGFIIAALTILITVKSNTSARGYADAKNAMEFLFSTKFYYHIVQVFTGAIIELSFIFIILYGSWLIQGNISDKCLYRILLFSTIAIIVTVFRVLYTLFKVLNLERLERT